MNKLVLLLLLLGVGVGVGVGRGETYVFDPGDLSCVLSPPPLPQVLVGCEGDSSPNQDGTSVHLFIQDGKLEVTQLLGNKIVYYSGESPVEALPDLVFRSPVAVGALAPAPEGRVRGTLTLIGHVSKPK